MASGFMTTRDVDPEVANARVRRAGLGNGGKNPDDLQ
jgi:hypothetical protein